VEVQLDKINKMKEKIKALKLNEIPYSRYEKLEKFISETKDEDLLVLGMLSIYYDITQERIRELSLDEIGVMVNHINNEIAKGVKFHNIIKIDDITYGFIPNFEKITAGELIDLDTLLKDSNWVGIFSILYRPLIGRVDKWGNYEIEAYKEFNETTFENISAYNILGCRDFFLKSFQILNQDSSISTL
jgi:hypothetical protein